MLNFLKKYKGYIIHAAGVGLLFLDPSVRHALAQHPDISAVGGLVWGWLLHWAQGK